jgi:hypothetical protein
MGGQEIERDTNDASSLYMGTVQGGWGKYNGTWALMECQAVAWEFERVISHLRGSMQCYILYTATS